MTEYTIYRLIDPRDSCVKYVGCTSNLEERLRLHIRHPEKTAKGKWISELQSEGLNPLAEVIETHADVTIAAEREIHWINQLKENGVSLTNGIINAKYTVRKKYISPPLEIEPSMRCLNLEKTAKIMQVTRKAVLDLIFEGELIAFKVGREYRVREVEIKAVMTRKQIKPKQAEQ